jgi:hypothetical protein
MDAALAPPSRTICVTSSVLGSIREIVPPIVLATQIEPFANARLPGCPGTGIRSTTAPVAGSARETVPALALAIQREPLPPARAAGACSSAAA